MWSSCVSLIVFAVVTASPAPVKVGKRQLLGLLNPAPVQDPQGSNMQGQMVRVAENVFRFFPADQRAPFSSMLMVFTPRQVPRQDLASFLPNLNDIAAALGRQSPGLTAQQQQQQQRGMTGSAGNSGQQGGQTPTPANAPTAITPNSGTPPMTASTPGAMVPVAGTPLPGAAPTNTGATTNAAGPSATSSQVIGSPSVQPQSVAALPGLPPVDTTQSATGVASPSLPALNASSSNATANATKTTQPAKSQTLTKATSRYRKRSEVKKEAPGGFHGAVVEKAKDESHAAPGAHGESTGGAGHGGGGATEQHQRPKQMMRAIQMGPQDVGSAGSARVRIALGNAAVKDSMEGLAVM